MKGDGVLHKTSLKERYDKEYVWYDKTRSSWMTGYTGSVEQETILSSLSENMILEIGTGTGRYAVLLRNRNYVGIDLNRKMLNKARERAPGVFIIAEAETLPFREAVFESIMCSRTFRFIQTPSKTLGEARRVLRKGGICVISVDFLRDFYGYKTAQSIFGKYPYETHYHVHELIDLYEKAKLAVIDKKMPFAFPETFYHRLPRSLWSVMRKLDTLLSKIVRGWLVVIIGKKA